MDIKTKFKRGDTVFYLRNSGVIGNALVAAIDVKVTDAAAHSIHYTLSDDASIQRPEGKLYASKEELAKAIVGSGENTDAKTVAVK